MLTMAEEVLKSAIDGCARTVFGIFLRIWGENHRIVLGRPGEQHTLSIALT